MNTVDLHVHSNASDGTFSPAELVTAAKKAGLSAFALTDHDTVSGIDEAVEAAKGTGIEVIPGIEISTGFLNREIHIVGLCIDYKSKKFRDAIGDEVQRRTSRNEKLIKLFNEHGFNVTMDAMHEMFPGSIITRAHFARYLVKTGVVKDNNEAFRKYLGDGMPLFVPKERKNPEQAIDMIRAANGVPILAHPLLYHLTEKELDSICGLFKEYGLMGIESMYSTYSGFDELFVKNLAGKHCLLESGGSDFHGANKPDIRLGVGRGNLMISYSYLQAVKDSVSYSPSV